MGFKDLVVSIDSSREGRERMALAIQLARRAGAHLLGYYVSPTVGEYVASPGPKLVDEEGREIHSGASLGEVAEAIEQAFEDALKAHGLKGVWLMSGERVVEDIVEHIRAADLAILGLGDPDRATANPQGFHPEDIILSCGRPILGVPIANLPERVGANILVAWDGSREASRAMNDALPLLVEAESVTVLSVAGNDHAARLAESAATHLRRHGAPATASVTPTGDLGIGELILAHSEHIRADLVVAGGYGHSRLSEAILGGVSLTLLRQMMVPVFMSH